MRSSRAPAIVITPKEYSPTWLGTSFSETVRAQQALLTGLDEENRAPLKLHRVFVSTYLELSFLSLFRQSPSPVGKTRKPSVPLAGDGDGLGDFRLVYLFFLRLSCLRVLLKRVSLFFFPRTSGRKLSLASALSVSAEVSPVLFLFPARLNRGEQDRWECSFTVPLSMLSRSFCRGSASFLFPSLLPCVPGFLSSLLARQPFRPLMGKDDDGVQGSGGG